MSSTLNIEEEKPENLKKTEEYKAIYEAQLTLRVFNHEKKDFDIKLPKTSCDRIIELYGKETILPLSFIQFSNPCEITETIRYTSRNINVRTSAQIVNILDILDNYIVYPISYEGLEEIEKMRKAPRIKSQYLKNISLKMGIGFSEMINYVTLQMTEINIK